MRYPRKPKFKVGDHVFLRPYDDFIEHISIPKYVWNDRRSNNPLEIKYVTIGQHSLKYQDEMVEDIYYAFDDGFSYSEEFLMEHFEPLPDELFEV